jgi:hypothetical protein
MKTEEGKNETQKHQLDIPVVSGSFNVPPVRVRWYGEHIDDIFDGTVIDSDDIYYYVIPDENTDMEVKWRKNECEVLR